MSSIIAAPYCTNHPTDSVFARRWELYFRPMLNIFPVGEGFPAFLVCFYSIFRWRLLCHDSCFHRRISIWSRCGLDWDKESVFRTCDFSLDSGFSGVQDTNLQDFLTCINIFYSSLYKMYVLIHFVLLCQTLSDIRTGYSWQGDCCCREDASRRQSRRK